MARVSYRRAFPLVLLPFILLVPFPIAPVPLVSGLRSVDLAGLDLTTMRAFETNFFCESAWCVAAGTSLRFDLVERRLETFGFGFSQDPWRGVDCLSESWSTLEPEMPTTAVIIWGFILCHLADSDEPAKQWGLFRLSVVADPETGRVFEGALEASWRGRLELSVR